MLPSLENCAPLPPTDHLAKTLVSVRELLGRDECYYFAGRFHFWLDAGWSIGVSPENGGRFRVEACHWSRPRVTLWSLDGEDEHLAGIVLELTELVGKRLGDESWRAIA